MLEGLHEIHWKSLPCAAAASATRVLKLIRQIGAASTDEDAEHAFWELFN